MRSRCKCDDSFQLPVTVESPSSAVTKKATSAIVTYEVKVKNNSSTRSVTIQSLSDDAFGDITMVQGSVATTNCGGPHRRTRIDAQERDGSD